MTAGQEYGNNIANKMCELQSAFRANLTHENDYYACVRSKLGDDETTADSLAQDVDFISDYLFTEVMELAKAILKADVYGMYTAGFVPFAKTYEEYRAKEREQTDVFYKDTNKEIYEHYKKLGEYYNNLYLGKK